MVNLQLDKKNKTILICAALVFLAALIVLIAVLVTQIDDAEGTDNPMVTEVAGSASGETEIVQVTQTDENGSVYVVTETDKEGHTVPVTVIVAKGENNNKNTTAKTGNNTVKNSKSNADNDKTTLRIPTLGEKKGENICTDDPENKYIVAVVSKYKVNPKLLVCIYPDNYDGVETDNNFVLQFDGTKDDNGKYIRSPDTLKYIYRVTAAGDVTRQDGSGPYGKVMFSLVTDLMMPQHPDMFDGV